MGLDENVKGILVLRIYLENNYPKLDLERNVTQTTDILSCAEENQTFIRGVVKQKHVKQIKQKRQQEHNPPKKLN